MYPDEQNFYDEDEHEKFYCPNIHEQKFMECLEENEVASNDSLNPKYRDCFEAKRIRFKKCNEENGAEFVLKRHFNRTRPKKCDKFNVVYSLTKDESNFLKPYDECSRPFVVQRIAHSNLILLITNRICAQVFATQREFNDVPKTVEYENSTFCHKMKMPMLFRNRPKSCMTHHERVSSFFNHVELCNLYLNFFNQEPKFDPKNEDRSQCGRGNKVKLHNLISLLSIILILLKALFST